MADSIFKGGKIMKDLSEIGKAISPSLTMKLSAEATKLRSEGINVISFNAGEPDFNTPQPISQAGIRAIEEGKTKYTPATGIKELKKAISKELHDNYQVSYEFDQIIISNGAKQSFFNALFALLNPEDEVLIPVPYWVSYPEMVKLNRGKPIFVTTDEKTKYKINSNILNSYITENTKAIILNNPSNPAGIVYTKEELIDITNFCVENNIYIIADEIYSKLVYDDVKFYSVPSLGDKVKKLTMLVNGMSKAYAMTGWRIGYLATENQAILDIIGAFQSQTTGNPCTISQVASIKALEEGNRYAAIFADEFLSRRNLMISYLKSLDDISFIEPQGAFYIMVDISSYIRRKHEKNIRNDVDFCDILLHDSHVSVIPGSGFGMDNYIRMSYSTSTEDIKEGMERFKTFLSTFK